METRIRDEMKIRIQEINKIYRILHNTSTKSNVTSDNVSIESPENTNRLSNPTPPRAHVRHHSALVSSNDQILPQLEGKTVSNQSSPDNVVKSSRFRKKFKTAIHKVIDTYVRPGGRKPTKSISPNPDEKLRIGPESLSGWGDDQQRYEAFADEPKRHTIFGDQPKLVKVLEDEPIRTSSRNEGRRHTTFPEKPPKSASGTGLVKYNPSDITLSPEDVIHVNTMPMPQVSTNDASTMIISQPKVLTKVRFTEEESQT